MHNNRIAIQQMCVSSWKELWKGQELLYWSFIVSPEEENLS